MSETEDNEVQVVDLSGYTNINYWLPRGEIQADWIGGDVSSKNVIWRFNNFVSQGKKAENEIDSATGRGGFTFNNTILEVTENEFADLIFIVTKIGQHVKDCSAIGHKLLANTCISVQKLDVIDDGGPAQELLDMCSSRLSKTCSKVYHIFSMKLMDVFQHLMLR